MTVTICRTEQKYAEDVQKLYTNPSVFAQTLHLPSQSNDNWKKWLGNIPDNVHSFVAIIKDNDKETVVGNIALRIETNERRKHIGNFVIAVSDEFQGQGIGKALLTTILDLADNWLNLKRVELTVYTDNQKAIALYQKFGFVIEGEHKAFAFRNGEFVNAYTMARIKA
ncbi:GNAT family N-acetyltransferase [Moraxella equi]|uniref:GNAT family N-acetyltransferase n=1 Tax=Moraxella equi TaxID=60442 RepID=A0A378QU05_9GAMM|nr:GNAT family N-acetyltransferase [Moraxella equi]OPH37834.1 GNAT family N-acetyltransferase [Moraxella equi]STZ04141.1 Spermidine N(1)-acetyltransferase [Moraxella equi]